MIKIPGGNDGHFLAHWASADIVTVGATVVEVVVVVSTAAARASRVERAIKVIFILAVWRVLMGNGSD